MLTIINHRVFNLNKTMKHVLAHLLVFALVVTSVLVVPTSDSYAASAVKKSKGDKRSAAMELISKDGAAFDYRVAAGESLYGYDTLQGACANGGYAYLTLYDRTVECCKIAKLNLNTLEVVRVSDPLPIFHGNNLTFNTRKNLIVATCCKVMKKRAVFIDPETLTVAGWKDIKLTKKVKKLPKSVRRKYKGFTAIAYNEARNCYVGRLINSGNVIIFDGELNPKKYVKLKGRKTSLLNQGMDSAGKYIYDVRSFRGKRKYNLVTVHTFSGKYVGRVKFPYGAYPGNELECLFHDGRQFYVGFYLTSSQDHDIAEFHPSRNNLLYRVSNMIQ